MIGFVAAAVGSSPLTRGKLGPAPRWSTCLPAHPRSRGENGEDRELLASNGGSSPLTRGKRHTRSRRRVRVGLIPAHAGKTLVTVAFGRERRAHPRSRGENMAPNLTGMAPAGSSPLTRGKPLISGQTAFPWRLIPAHAGKTA